jgi:hypothetical protein
MLVVRDDDEVGRRALDLWTLEPRHLARVCGDERPGEHGGEATTSHVSLLSGRRAFTVQPSPLRHQFPGFVPTLILRFRGAVRPVEPGSDGRLNLQEIESHA